MAKGAGELSQARRARPSAPAGNEATLNRGGTGDRMHRECLDWGTGSVEWEWLPILKQSLIQTPVQFSRDPYVVEIPGRMGICMPYVVYPINASRVFVRELFGLDHGVGHFRPLSITRQRHWLV
jgi:hypothetical protein